MTIKELQDALDEVEVKYDPKANKEELQKLYDDNVEEVDDDEPNDEDEIVEDDKDDDGEKKADDGEKIVDDNVEDKPAEDTDYLRQYQYKKVNDTPTVGGILTDPEKGSKAERMKAHLLTQPKVRIIVQKEQGEEGTVPKSVNLNGYRLDLPKNVYIDLPEQVAQLLMNSQQQKENALNDPTRIDGNEKKENALL